MATSRGRQGRHPAKERRWRRLLKDWRRSGLSVREFCDWQALSEPSFYSWRRELGKRDRDAASRRDSRQKGLLTDAAQFLPVHVVEDAAQDSPASRCVEVQLPSGVCLRVPAGFDRQTLVDVLAALEGREGAPQC